MKKKTMLLILSLVLSIGGIVTVGFDAGWLTTLGIVLLLWGNNIERSTRART